ncbi:MAG: H-X9-DG-CTERM domain-containing protein [Planctomycetota bacterium]
MYLHDILVAADVADDIEERLIKGVRLQSLPIEDVTLLWGLHKDCFLVTLGTTAAGKVIDCMNGDAATLPSSAEFKFDRRKVDATLDGMYFCVYFDMRGALAKGREVATQIMGELPPIVDQAIDELGLNSVKSKYVHYDRPGDQPRLTSFGHIDGPSKGLLTLWDQQSLSDEDLKIVPRDAYWMQVNNLDLSAVWTEAMRILAELAPDAAPMVDGSLAMSQEMLGFSVVDDLLPAFGDTWAFFDAPDHGGILLTGTVLVAEVKNAEALQGILTRMIELITPLLAEETDAVLSLHTLTRGDHTIHYVMIGGVPSPVCPAWGFTGDRWILGLYPQTVATAMRQVDPRTRTTSILDHPDFRAARAKLPQDIMGIAYYDSKYFVRLFYPFINALSTAGFSMLAEYGVEVDLDLVPPLAEYVGNISSYVGTSSRDDDGVLYANAGDGVPLAMVAGGAAFVTSIALPSLTRARMLAKRAVSMDNLRGIGQGCFIYANDHDERFPDSLDQLIAEEMITEKILQSPEDPPGTVSYIYINGQQASGRWQNVLAYERVRDDEGTNVLFGDGHVEFVSIDRLKELVRETYTNLGREDEIPADFRP